MDPSLFGESKTGQLVPVSGTPGVTHGFIPHRLPPDWIWPERLWPLLLDAHRALASLDGTGKNLPDPTLLLRPLQNREAQRSSSLEGTITDPQQQALFQLEPKLPASSTDPANAEREVFNYGQALLVGLTEERGLPLSLRLIRRLHGILMDGVRGSDQSPGDFRRTQNYIGSPPRFVPPPVSALEDCLDAFEKYLHAPKHFDPLVEAFLAHYQFEAIHPFADGNGRVGRLVLALTISEWCGLSDQWLYMSAYFDRNKDHYIDYMFQVSANGKWEAWIEFCLRGVAEQARDTEDRCTRLLALSRQFQEKLREIGGSIRLSAIVNDLFESPVAMVTHVQRRHDVAYPTARSDLKKLERAGILRRIEGYPRIAYYCPQVFDITHGD